MAAAQRGGGSSVAKQAEQSGIDLARTSADPDTLADFFEHDAGCRETSVTIGTDWAEMRIGRERLAQIRNSGKGSGV